MSWGLLFNSLALALPVALATVTVGWLAALFIASSRGGAQLLALVGVAGVLWRQRPGRTPLS